MTELSKGQWKRLTANLEDALQSWQKVSDQVETQDGLAPDEKTQNDIEKLLQELKYKLDELSHK